MLLSKTKGNLWAYETMQRSPVICDVKTPDVFIGSHQLTTRLGNFDDDKVGRYLLEFGIQLPYVSRLRGLHFNNVHTFGRENVFVSIKHKFLCLVLSLLRIRISATI